MSSQTRSWIGSCRARGARFVVDDLGVAAVEFAMLLPMFVALVLVSLLVGISFLAKAELDYTTQKVARLVMTGQITTSAQLQSAVCTYTGGLINCSAIMANLTTYTAANLDNINTATPTLTYSGSGSVTNTWNTQFGSGGTVEVLQLMYQFPMMSGPMFNLATQSNGDNLMISTAVFVNECSTC